MLFLGFILGASVIGIAWHARGTKYLNQYVKAMRDKATLEDKYKALLKSTKKKGD